MNSFEQAVPVIEEQEAGLRTMGTHSCTCTGSGTEGIVSFASFRRARSEPLETRIKKPHPLEVRLRD